MVLLQFESVLSVLSGTHQLPIRYVSVLFSDIVRLNNAHIMDHLSHLTRFAKKLETEESPVKSINVH